MQWVRQETQEDTRERLFPLPRLGGDGDGGLVDLVFSVEPPQHRDLLTPLQHDRGGHERPSLVSDGDMGPSHELGHPPRSQPGTWPVHSLPQENSKDTDGSAEGEIQTVKQTERVMKPSGIPGKIVWRAVEFGLVLATH